MVALYLKILNIDYDEKTKCSKEAKVFDNKRIDLEEIYEDPFFNKGKGLIDADFPDFFKMSKKDFEDKIKLLEKNVKMTEISCFQKKVVAKDEEKEGNNLYISKKSGNDIDSKLRANSLNPSLGTSENSNISNYFISTHKGNLSTNDKSNQISISDSSFSNLNSNRRRNRPILNRETLKTVDESNEISGQNEEATPKKSGIKKTKFLIDEKEKIPEIHNLNIE